jgi:pimeloyl-ACP methyl ester carboxylesterase
MIESLAGAAPLIDDIQWLSAQLHRLLNSGQHRAPHKNLLTLPSTRFSHTAFGTRAYISAGAVTKLDETPTVIFESGLGDGKEVWAPVFSSISQITRAVAYDRAGYGQSEGASGKRDGLQIIKELRTMLQAEKIAPPYVLVGHSLGGTIVKLFARMYPNEVAGVVLVDARPSDFTQRCQKMGLMRLLYEPPLAWFMRANSAIRGELLAAQETMKQAHSIGSFPNIPLQVLTHRRRIFHWASGVARAWADSQSSMAGMSAKGLIKVCDHSGHHVHRDRPDLVIRAVLSVVAQATDASHGAQPTRARPPITRDPAKRPKGFRWASASVQTNSLRMPALRA